jgi:hypothetical protein
MSLLALRACAYCQQQILALEKFEIAGLAGTPAELVAGALVPGDGPEGVFRSSVVFTFSVIAGLELSTAADAGLYPAGTLLFGL